MKRLLMPTSANPTLALSMLLVFCGLSGCKKAEQAPTNSPDTPAPAASTPATPPPAPADNSPETLEKAKKQAALDYATMEDSSINDPKAQWAVAAKASSSFGDANQAPADSQNSNTPWQATGAPNGKVWTNNNQDIGFDWLELSFEKPVAATEVRVITTGNHAAESINKIELIDTDGKAHTVWSGLSDVKQDDRGSRTWFVRKFDATPYQTKTVKVTMANNVSSGYKEIDAAQLVGQ